jgi:hypothetical protein
MHRFALDGYVETFFFAVAAHPHNTELTVIYSFFQNGAPRKFYFFLLPSYWLGPAKEKGSANGNVVQVNDVRKSYGNFDALKSVTMTMTGGEITALLGHNGKTERCF